MNAQVEEVEMLLLPYIFQTFVYASFQECTSHIDQLKVKLKANLQQVLGLSWFEYFYG